MFLCFCVSVKNLTVAIDEETYRAARIAAAERGMSVSALVRGLLSGLHSPESRVEAISRAFKAMDEVEHFAAGNRLTREALHDR